MAEPDKRVGVNLRPHIDPNCSECKGSGIGHATSLTEFFLDFNIETEACVCMIRSVEAMNRLAEDNA